MWESSVFGGLMANSNLISQWLTTTQICLLFTARSIASLVRAQVVKSGFQAVTQGPRPIPPGGSISGSSAVSLFIFKLWKSVEDYAWETFKDKYELEFMTSAYILLVEIQS